MNSAAFSFEMRETKRAYADLNKTPPSKHVTDGGTIAAGPSQEGEEQSEHRDNSNSFCPQVAISEAPPRVSEELSKRQ